MQPNAYQSMPPQYQPLPAAPKKNHHWGIIITVVLLTLTCLGLLGFGLWAFMSRQDYKKNTDKKISDAVIIAKQQESTAKDKEFVQKEKEPLKDYKGPATYGSLVIKYPKTWSGFVTEKNSGSPVLDAYFHPNVVPGIQSGTAFALRIKIVNQQYAEVLKSFNEKARSGKLSISAFRAEQVPSVLGSRIDGEINTGQKNSMVLFPIRDKTLQISTESSDFLNDFNTIILPNLTFVP
jgi:hypothetical protein